MPRADDGPWSDSRGEQRAGRAGFDLPGDAPAGSLRTGAQQKVEILRALAREAELIVMDEPSAALSGPEKEQLHEIVRTLPRNGTTVLLVSHALREVLSLAATVTILRDGRVSRVLSAQSASGEALAFTVLAGIVVGGTEILGGEGAVWRTFVGVLFIALVGNGFDLLGLDPLYEQITLGVIMLLAVGVDAWARQRGGTRT